MSSIVLTFYLFLCLNNLDNMIIFQLSVRIRIHSAEFSPKSVPKSKRFTTSCLVKCQKSLQILLLLWASSGQNQSYVTKTCLFSLDLRLSVRVKRIDSVCDCGVRQRTWAVFGEPAVPVVLRLSGWTGGWCGLAADRRSQLNVA